MSQLPNESMLDEKYNKLRALLAEQSFPHLYIHKFIGQRTDAFLASMDRLEEKFPKVKRISTRESAGQTKPVYLACTYELLATNVEEIIDLLKATALMSDLRVIL